MQLTDVPLPDHDEAEKAEMAIHNLMKKHEPQLHEIGEKLGLSIYQPNTLRRIIAYCYRQNDFFWLLMGTENNANQSIEDCINQMRRLNISNVSDLIKITSLAYELGIDYRMEWLSL